MHERNKQYTRSNAKSIDVIMLMHNLARYIDHYSETFGSLWECYTDEPITNDAGVITDFTNNGDGKSFNLEEKITGQANSKGRKDLKIMVPLPFIEHLKRI